ncbi:MAG: hypothetical protein B5M56_08615 [Desulfococcus sp. 4484_241]|nr:MAG: hypothetical protein B5M56_08615 [Desulfococcus sp. 4484_241]
MPPFKRRVLPLFVLVVAIMTASGCTHMMRTGITIAHPALENMETSLFREGNLELAREGLPGTIMLLNGMLETSPDDMLLLTMAVKAYVGLGMMIEDESPNRATALYARGTEFGIRALKHNRCFRKALENGERISEAVRCIKSEKYLPALVWTLASMGANVLLNVDDPMIAIDLGNVRAMASQAVSIDSDYFYGFANLFVGVANSMLPPAFGGDREKAKKAFDAISKMNDGKFLLSKVYYARFYVTDSNEARQIWQSVADAPDRLIPEIELINQIAKAKARHYLKRKGSL